MNIEQVQCSVEKIKEYAKALRLTYLFNNIDDELTRCENLSLSAREIICDLLYKETMLRSEKSKAARIKNAGFPYKKYIDELDPDRLPKEAKLKLSELKTLDFVANGQNIVEYGNPGTGKNPKPNEVRLCHCSRY